MPEIAVPKFGGTSMAYPERVARIVDSRLDHALVVVSAPGTDADHPVKMTDQLVGLIELGREGKAKKARALIGDLGGRFDDLYQQVDGKTRRKLGKEFRGHLSGYQEMSEADVLSIGEYFSAKYFAELVGGEFMSPDWIKFTRSGRLLRDKTAIPTDTILDLNGKRPLIVPGFYGVDKNGDRHLLGRSGSDRTQILAGVSIGRIIGDHNVLCENYTDVDGIKSGHPKIVDNPHTIAVLTRDEVREGAHAGTGVLQGDAIVDMKASDIEVVILDTFNPNLEGTRIVKTRDSRSDERPVVAVAGRDDLLQISIHDVGMAEASAYASSLLMLLGKRGISVEHMPSTQDTFSITIREVDKKSRVHPITGKRVPSTLEKAEESIEEAQRKDLTSPQARCMLARTGVVYAVGERLRRVEEVQRTQQRINGLALANHITALPLPAIEAPCIPILVDRNDVQQLTKLVHDTEVNGLPRSSGSFSPKFAKR